MKIEHNLYTDLLSVPNTGFSEELMLPANANSLADITCLQLSFKHPLRYQNELDAIAACILETVVYSSQKLHRAVHVYRISSVFVKNRVTTYKGFLKQQKWLDRSDWEEVEISVGPNNIMFFGGIYPTSDDVTQCLEFSRASSKAFVTLSSASSPRSNLRELYEALSPAIKINSLAAELTNEVIPCLVDEETIVCRYPNYRDNSFHAINFFFREKDTGRFVPTIVECFRRCCERYQPQFDDLGL